MFSFYRKYYKTAFDIGLIILTVLLIMWLFSFLYAIAAPIFIAFVIFIMIEPFAKFLHRRKIKKSIATAISMMFFLLILLGGLIGAGALFVTQISALADKIPAYAVSIQKQVLMSIDYWQAKVQTLPEGLMDKVGEYTAMLTDGIARFSQWFLLWLLSSISSVSTFIVHFGIGLILAYFLSIEIDFWKKTAAEKTPRTFKTAFYFLKDNVLSGIGKYLKAQFKLVSITFIIIYITLLALRVNSAFSIAVLAAVFDVLPLLGVSTIFIPWIIYLFIVGHNTLAISLTILLAVVILFRQILEPKIMGDSLGVSAFTMLAFMIISLSLFGVAGLVLSPILIILIKALYEQGYLQQWIRLPEDEFDHS